MIDISTCILVGTITKPHGNKGNVQVKFSEGFDAELLHKTESVFLCINGLLVPFLLNDFEYSGQQAIISLENILSVEKAAIFKTRKVYIKTSPNFETNLPNIDSETFIGFIVTDKNAGVLGELVNVVTIPGNHLFEINHKGKIILFPAHPDLITFIDYKNKNIIVETPVGLIDLF